MAFRNRSFKVASKTPYKRLETIETGVLPLPPMTIIDFSQLRQAERSVYEEARMMSTEA